MKKKRKNKKAKQIFEKIFTIPTFTQIPELKIIKFSYIDYDPLSKENALIVYEGELEQGNHLELLQVYPERASTSYYLRIDDRAFAYGPNSELKKFCKKRSIKDFLNLKLGEYYDQQQSKV